MYLYLNTYKKIYRNILYVLCSQHYIVGILVYYFTLVLSFGEYDYIL